MTTDAEKARNNEKAKLYRLRNPERAAEAKKRYRERNLETLREKEAVYARRHREEIRKSTPRPESECVDCGDLFVHPSGGRSPRCPDCRETWGRALRKGRQRIYDAQPQRRFRNRELSPEKRAEYAANSRDRSRELTRERRRKALDLLGGPVCLRCGLQDYRVLEIDHVDGGGNQERYRFGMSSDRTVTLVLKGDTSRFRVLCRNCNWIAHLERKEAELHDGQLPDGPCERE